MVRSSYISFYPFTAESLATTLDFSRCHILPTLCAIRTHIANIYWEFVIESLKFARHYIK